MSEMIKRLAAFLKLRDERLLTGKADDAERTESAREIIALLREPTEAMKEAATQSYERHSFEDYDSDGEFMGMHFPSSAAIEIVKDVIASTLDEER